MRFLLVRVLVVILVTPWCASAQGTAALLGVVRDTTGRPLAGAAVALDPDRNIRGTRTDAQGRFRFDRVTQGRHTLRTTWIGHRPDDRVITVPSGGLSVDIVLVPSAQQLDTLAIVARRSGVIGTVLDGTTLRRLNRSTVEALGTRWRATTREDGQFEFAEAPHGAYVISVRRDGYQTRLIPATVPEEGAVEIAAALRKLSSDSETRREFTMREMSSRIVRRNRNQSAIVSRNELLAIPGAQLDQAVQYAPSVVEKGLIASDYTLCRLYVDGRFEPYMALGDLKADDVAMVEVYNAGNCAQQTSGARTHGVVQGTGGVLGVNVYVWLKR